jgi:hypothetical protein
MYSRVTMNIVGARLRYEMLGGRQYLVVPAVMLTSGVHAGSQGPLLYEPTELAKNPMAWNHKPVVLYHPTMNGEGISACDPEVIDRQGIGLMFNSSNDGRLKTEVWLDETKANKVDNRVVDSLKAGKMVEISTGLHHDLDAKTGTWNGKEYTGIVRNIQPDHLAVLPDQLGACSIADGGGLLRNADGSELSYDDIREQLRGLLKECGAKSSGMDSCYPGESGYCYVSDVYPKYAIYEHKSKCFKIGFKVKAGKVSIVGEPEEVRKVTSYVTANGKTLTTNDDDFQGPVRLPPPGAEQLSDVNRKQQMESALKEHYAGVQQEGDWGGWVTELYANYVIWSKDGKTYKLPYTYDDDKITFDGEPEEVERVTEYRTRRKEPIDGTSSPYNINQKEPGMGQQQTTTQQTQKPTILGNTIHKGAHEIFRDPGTSGEAHHEGSNPKNDSQVRTTVDSARKEEVNSMIGAGHAAEEDRSFLEGLPDDNFKKVATWAKRGASQPITPYSYAGIGDRSNAHGPGTLGTSHNQQTQNQQTQTDEDYILNSNLPPQLKEAMLGQLDDLRQKRNFLINTLSTITLPNGKQFTPQWLASQPTNILEAMMLTANAAAKQQQQQQRPTGNNYTGQGELSMFTPTVNQAGSSGDELPSYQFQGVFASIPEDPARTGRKAS